LLKTQLRAKERKTQSFNSKKAISQKQRQHNLECDAKISFSRMLPPEA
jgi:hypothetical protein